jgi:O-methyltransferase
MTPEITARADDLARQAVARGALQKVSELAPLVAVVAERTPRTIVEIGTSKGGTFYTWCQVAAPDALLVSIDLPDGPYGEGYEESDIPRLRSFAQPDQELRFLRVDSHLESTRAELIELLGGREIDYLMIDGDHTYDGVRRDFEMYAPLVGDGGLVAFHDILPHPEFWDCAVDRFWRRISRRYEHEEFLDPTDERGYGQWGGIGLIHYQAGRAVPSEDPKALYLDLLKKSLTNLIYGVEFKRVTSPTRWRQAIVDAFDQRGMQVVEARNVDVKARVEGREWPLQGHTMIGMKRLDNLERCVEDVIEQGVPGDLIETGVWRGGAAIFMRALLKAHGVTDRTVWAADSFEGLPAPDAEKYPADAGDIHHTFTELAIPVDDVKANFAQYGLLDDQVRFLEGWFRDTLPQAPIDRLAVLRLDGDIYESTTDALTALYPKLSPGGYVIIDDFHIPSCREAVGDYRREHGITDEIERIDWAGVFWRRSS